MSVSSRLLPLNVYYDLDLIENSAGDVEFQKIQFSDTRSNDLLNNPSAYMVSIVRFNLQTSGSIPVWIPVIQSVSSGNMDPNKTIYSFTMTYQGYEFRQYLEYAPTDTSVDPPADSGGNFIGQNSTNSYYWVYTFQRIQELMNYCLEDAYNGLNALVLAGTGNNLPSFGNIPFIEFNPNNGACTLNADSVAFDIDGASPIEIYMNNPMFNLFSNFPVYRYGIQNITNGKNYKFNIKNQITNIFNVKTGYDAIQIYSDLASNIGLFNPVKSIVFSTSLLPVLPTLVGNPKIFNADASVSASQTNSLKAPILIDFVVPISGLSQNTYTPEIYYEPSGELRFSDIISNTPITSISLDVFWKDAYGNLIPIRLQNQCSASVKLLFRRKDYFNYVITSI